MAYQPGPDPTSPGTPPTQAEPAPGSPPPTEQWAPATEQWVPAGPAPARWRGFPRWLVATGGAATAVLAVAVFLAVLLWPAGAAAPLPFHPLERTGTVTLDEDADAVQARIAGDQMYVAAERTTEAVVVAATDRTGTVQWERSVDDLRDVGSMTVTPDAILVHGDAAGFDPPEWLVALDRDDGTLRWRRSYYDDDRRRTYTDMIVLLDREEDQVLGLDPGSGEVAWSLDPPADQSYWVEPVLTDDDLAGISRGGTHVTPRHGDRVVVVHEDESAQVVDITTGDVRSQGQAIGDTSTDQIFAHGDRMFVASAADGRVYRFDLTQLDAPPDIVYTVAPERSVAELVTCGEQRVCLVEDTGEEHQVVAVDTGGDGEVWRHPVPGDQHLLLPVGEQLLVGTDEQTVLGYDRDGQEVLNRPGGVARLNAGNVLLFRGDSVAGVSLGSGSAERQELGPLPDDATDCDWDEQYIACATDEGAGIWQFAD